MKARRKQILSELAITSRLHCQAKKLDGNLPKEEWFAIWDEEV